MISFGLSSGSLMGIIDVLLSVVLLTIYLLIAIFKKRELGCKGMIVLIIQSFISALILFLSGSILILIYFGLRDMFIFNIFSQTRLPEN